MIGVQQSIGSIVNAATSLLLPVGDSMLLWPILHRGCRPRGNQDETKWLCWHQLGRESCHHTNSAVWPQTIPVAWTHPLHVLKPG